MPERELLANGINYNWLKDYMADTSPLLSYTGGMHIAPVRYLLAGQAGLLGGLLVCFAMRPDVVAGAGGFSNYGALAQTVVSYTLAFALGGGFTAGAARRLPRESRRAVLLSRALYVLAVLYVIVLLSTYPYHAAAYLDVLHRVVGAALFSWQIVLAAWLAAVVGKSWLHYVLLAGVMAGSLFSLLSLLEVVYLLSEAQAVTVLSFGILLVHATNQLTASQSKRE
jgi:hypothetical protein